MTALARRSSDTLGFMLCLLLGWLVVQRYATLPLSVGYGAWSFGNAAPLDVIVTSVRPVVPTNDRERFAVDLAAALGNSAPTPELLALLVAWQQGEGTASTFNPLATTQDWPGATIYNSVGVKNYASYQDGIAATVKTLSYGYAGYADIVAGIKANDPALALRGLYASPWGTSATLVEQVYHERLAQQAQPSAGGTVPRGHPLAGALVITQGYGVGTHAPANIWGGVDYAGNVGDPAYAIIDGTAEVSETMPCGLGVRVRDERFATLYCHLSAASVTTGQHVEAGQQVGAVGASGQASGPHLHVEVRDGDVIIDPTTVIK